jgi:hypothetical protein
MKRLLVIAPLGILLTVQTATLGQEVFVTRGAGSPVFSDKPQPGAKPVTLPPLNVVAPVLVPASGSGVVAPAGAQEESRKAPAPAPVYGKFKIVFPEDNGSVVANTALFEVRVAVDPALQLGEGHAFTVRINGRPVGQRFTATEFMIPPEFWGDTLPPANQRQQLDAAIVDRSGTVLMSAVPVTFYLRYATGVHRQPWLRPLPVPVAKQRPPAGINDQPCRPSSRPCGWSGPVARPD